MKMRDIVSKCSLVLLLAITIGCGNDSKPPAGNLFEIVVSNGGQDTVFNYGIDVNLVRVEQAFTLKHGEEILPVQIEDRNNNGTPDRMFAMVDLPPGRLIKLEAHAGDHAMNRSNPLVGLHASINGNSVKEPYTYSPGDQWDGDGLIMDNEWVGFRYLMRPPFAFDIIGKRRAQLLTSDQMEGLSQMSEWGGDALDEGLSLGIGSPALYDQAQIIPLTDFDHKEVNILENGPLRSEVQIITRGIPVRGEKIDVRIDWQMEGGKHWSANEVSILTKTDLNLQFAFGLPKHNDATDFTQGLLSHTHFAYTYGLQDSHGEHLGMAILIPEGYEIDTYRDDPHNYFYLVNPIEQKVNYRILASWGKGRNTVIDEVDFLGVIKDYCSQYGASIQIKPDFHID